MRSLRAVRSFIGCTRSKIHPEPYREHACGSPSTLVRSTPSVHRSAVAARPGRDRGGRLRRRLRLLERLQGARHRVGARHRTAEGGLPGPRGRQRQRRLAHLVRHGPGQRRRADHDPHPRPHRGPARRRLRQHPVRRHGRRTDQPGRPHRLRHGHLRAPDQGHVPRSGRCRGQGGQGGRDRRPERRSGRQRRRAERAVRRAHGRDRRRGRRGRGAVPRLRLARRLPAADRHRAGERRHRLRGHRPARPPDDRRGLRTHARPADRARRGHRLRAVHRHPAPARTEARPERHRGRHRRRRHHRPRPWCSRVRPCASPCWAC